jgi:two-component system NtrC family sensor kinase
MTPEERERLQRMEQMGLLAAGLAHDFNNFAVCVLGELASVEARLRELDNLVASWQGPEGEAARRALEDCKRSLQTVDTGMQMSVSNSRDLLRLHRGEPRPANPAGTDLRRSAERALRLAGARLRPVAELRNGDQIRVAVSEDVLVRVFLNLLINASDAFPPGAPQPRVRLQISAAGSRAICDVIDNGPGVPREVLARLFQPFASTRGPGGTGLGLAVSRQLLRAAGGELQLVETGAGRTVFRLTLPLVASAPSADDGSGVTHMIAATLRDESRKVPPKRRGVGMIQQR